MFLVLSEDLKWCKDNLVPLNKNVVLVSEKESVVDDLALLTMGNHTIMSIGTYGLWGAILSGGEIAFPANRIGKKDYYVQKNLLEINDSKIIKIYWKKE